MSGGGTLSSWAIDRPLPAVMVFFVLVELAVLSLMGGSQYGLSPRLTLLRRCAEPAIRSHW